MSEEQSFDTGMKDVSVVFSRGVNHIVSIFESAEKLTPAITVGELDNFSKDLSLNAAESFKCLRSASDRVENLNSLISTEIQALANEKGQKETSLHLKEIEIKSAESELGELEKNLDTLKEKKREAESEYEDARRRFNEAEKELEEEKKTQEAVKTTGTVLLAVPIVGWACSAVMLPLAFTVLEDRVNTARKCSENALENKRTQEKRVESKQDDLDKSKKRISKARNRQTELRREIRELADKKRALQEKLTTQAEICVQLKQAATYISTAANRAEILHDQTQFLNDLPSISGPLHALAGHLSLPEISKIKLLSLTDSSNHPGVLMKLEMVCAAERRLRTNRLYDHQKGLQVVMLSKCGEKMVNTIEMIDDLLTQITEQNVEERNLTMSSHASWEQFINPAPLTIAFLGQLVLLSLTKDFSMDKNQPEGGFRHIKWPKSFRASMIQVAEAGWKAFHSAQLSMDFIGINASTIPGNLIAILTLLESAHDDEIATRIENRLLLIKSTSDKCLKKAKHVDSCFLDVMNIIGELQEALVATKSQTEESRRKAKIDMKIVQEQEEASKERQKFYREREEKLQNKIKEAQQNFEEALHSKPGVLDTCGMAVTDGIFSAVNNTVDLVSRPFKKINQMISDEDTNAPELKESEADTETKSLIEESRQNEVQQNIEQEVTSVSGIVGKCKTAITKTFRSAMSNTADRISRLTHTTADEDNSNSLDDENSQEVFEILHQLRDQVNILTEKFVKNKSLKKISKDNKDQMIKCAAIVRRFELDKLAECNIKRSTRDLCQQTLAICEELGEIAKSFVPGNNDGIAESILSLQRRVAKEASKGKTCSHNLKKKPPNRKKWMPSTPEGGSAKYELDKFRMRVENSKDELERAQAEYDKICKSQEQANEKLASILAEVAKINLMTADFEVIIDLLSRGLRELAHLKEQWGEMIHFFQTVSSLIGSSMNIRLKSFGDYCRAEKERVVPGYSLAHFKRDLLYNQVFQASEIAQFLYHVTDSYVDVSKKFLVPNVERLMLLIQLDPDTQKKKIQTRLKDLEAECKTSQREIKTLVQRKKQEFDSYVKQKFRNIKRIEQKSVPAIKASINEIEPDDLV